MQYKFSTLASDKPTMTTPALPASYSDAVFCVSTVSDDATKQNDKLITVYNKFLSTAPIENGSCDTTSTKYIEVKSFYTDKKVTIKTLVNTSALSTINDKFPLKFDIVIEAYMVSAAGVSIKKSYQTIEVKVAVCDPTCEDCKIAAYKIVTGNYLSTAV